jgi:hypothetical protein
MFDRNFIKKVMIYICMGVISACSGLTTERTDLPKPTVNGPTSNKQTVLPDYVTPRSLKELIDWADIIVIGKMSEKREIFNGARLPSNTAVADPDVLGVSQVYEFVIEKYIKGNGPQIIFVASDEGILFGKGVGETLNAENIKKAKEGYYHPVIDDKHTYLLLLDPMKYPDKKNYYTGTPYPWIFDVTNPRSINAEMPYDFNLYYSLPEDLEEFIFYVNNPSLIPTQKPFVPTVKTQSPYPAPYPATK